MAELRLSSFPPDQLRRKQEEQDRQLEDAKQRVDRLLEVYRRQFGRMP